MDKGGEGSSLGEVKFVVVVGRRIIRTEIISGVHENCGRKLFLTTSFRSCLLCVGMMRRWMFGPPPAVPFGCFYIPIQSGQEKRKDE